MFLFLVNQCDYSDAINALEDADRYTFSYRLQFLEAACFIGLGDVKKGLTALEEALQESFEDHDILLKAPVAISENKEVISIISYYEN